MPLKVVRAAQVDQTRRWPLKWHYYCEACGWLALKSEYQEEPKRCPKCGAEPK